MLAEARANRVVTQMGQHGHSNEGARRLCEYVWAGVIGQVTEVYCWCDRLNAREQPLAQDSECPKNLDWDKWIGPAAWRGYNRGLHPVGWYSWRRFGSATIGNMGNHVIDPVFWALKPAARRVSNSWISARAQKSHGAFATISSGSSRSVVTLRLSRCIGLTDSKATCTGTTAHGRRAPTSTSSRKNTRTCAETVEIEKKHGVDLGRCASILVGEKAFSASACLARVCGLCRTVSGPRFRRRPRRSRASAVRIRWISCARAWAVRRPVRTLTTHSRSMKSCCSVLPLLRKAPAEGWIGTARPGASRMTQRTRF